MSVHASLVGPRGAVKGDARGDLAIRRAPSGLLVIEVNRRPDHWSGEWSGDTLAMFLTAEQAIELGDKLIAAGKSPDGCSDGVGMEPGRRIVSTNGDRPDPGAPVACPYCGNALTEGMFHSCRELRADQVRAPREINLGRIGDLFLILLVIAVAAYLGAYFLTSQGICPGAS